MHIGSKIGKVDAALRRTPNSGVLQVFREFWSLEQRLRRRIRATMDEQLEHAAMNENMEM